MKLNDRREYKSPLRAAQAEQTRNLILESACDIVLDGRGEGASVREIAARAGVSERTVYRYFPDRAALLDGLDEWLTQRMASAPLEEGLNRTKSAEGLLDVTPLIFERFDDVERLVRASILLDPSPGELTSGRRRRTRMVERIVDGSFPELDEAGRLRLKALIRTLMSSFTWLRLRDEFELSGRESGELVAWALKVLFEEVRRGGRVGQTAYAEGPESATRAP